MNIQHASYHSEHGLSLPTYLTVQLQEIICMGPGHALTWTSNRDLQTVPIPTRRERMQDWLQVSVQGGTKCHLMVQFVVPVAFGDGRKRQLDQLFAQYGWTNEQADGRECLIYYIAQAPDARHLLNEAEFAAQQCSEVMRLLWDARTIEDIALLGARGPNLTKVQTVAQPQKDAAARQVTRAA